MSELIVSVSGVRGVVGESLTREVVERFTRAAASVLEDGAIVVSRDGRANGIELADHVSHTLSAGGRHVIQAGITSTPTTGILVRKFKAAGGIQISASHNPIQYNGLKLFDETGRVLTARQGEQVRDLYLAA
ncbi:MAG: phosphoglucosamine mutase, partial [Planctomycetaceae bacterium]|nr:phosphoglucosamine mutase [Planctomycetaceae bacterium]